MFILLAILLTRIKGIDMNLLAKVKNFIIGAKYETEDKFNYQQNVINTASEKVKNNTNNENEKKFSSQDENIILESIKSHFRVINESIDIARKSKNLDTTNSRLEVARKVLDEAKKTANQYSLSIEGFNEAEAEINRITNAVIAGAPKVMDEMREIEQDPIYSTPSRNLLKEATSLKKEKNTLRRVISC